MTDMQILAAVAFVLIWSTGFVIARFVVGVAGPTTFLLLRFVSAGLVLAVLALALRQRFPRGRALLTHLGIGALVNGVYLGVGYIAVDDGLPAGIMALLGGWNPVLTLVVVAFFTRRAPAPGVVIGVVVSLVGIAGVLVPGLLGDTAGGRVTPVLLLLGLVSITALALGTLAQKRAGAVDLIPAVAVQTLGGALVTGLGVLTLREGAPAWGDADLWIALGWSALVVSVGAMILMVHLTRTISAVFVSVLILTTPPLAAAEAFLLFGDRLTVLQWVGIGVTLCGVGIATLVPRRVEPAATVGESGRADSGDGAGRADDSEAGSAAEAPAECTARR